jgi:drug/metabolite transporter (DMT)-like permease
MSEQEGGRTAARGVEETLPVPASPVGMLLLLSCIAIWGVNAVTVKIATKPPTGVGFDPVFLTGLRFLVVAPCLAAMVALRGRAAALRLEKGDGWRYAAFGFVAIVLAETLIPMALRYSTVANVTLLSHGTLSLFTALWALLLFGQRLARTGWAGAAIALVGVGVVAGSAPTTGARGGLHFGGANWRGDAFAIFRSVEHSCYLLYLSRWLRQRSVLQVTVYNCVFGALWLLPYVIYRAVGFPWAQVPPIVWGAFAWTVIPTTLYGFLAWNWGMSRVGAVAASNMFYLMPISAAVAAWAILGEPVTRGQALGGLVIIIGILLLRWDTMVAAGLRLPDWRLRLPWGR